MADNKLKTCRVDSDRIDEPLTETVAKVAGWPATS
jgi:hypothetical protein